ncbi:MAG: hypothetical protein U0S36_01975 [Candidatus Nanopelagicales bacterium]
MGVVAELTSARLRRHPAGWLLLVLGVALALALPVLAAATGRVVSGRALENAVAALPAGERTVVAAYGGTQDVERQRRDDAVVRAGLAELTSLPVSAQMLFGEISDGAGATFRLGASDALASQVQLTSGRLPASCTPQRCEVVATGTAPAPALDPSLGLVVVGSAVRTDPLLLPGTFDPGPGSYVLLGSDPAALQRLAALERFPRGAGWVGAIDPERITSLGVPAYADLSRSVADRLALDVDTLVLAVPDDALLREDARASTSQGRFALIGGAAAVLVLGFVLVAATGLRRDHRDAAALLRRRGASRGTRAAFALAGAAVAVAVGALLGLGLGWVSAYAATSAQPLHPPAAAQANASVLDALPAVVLLAVAAVALTAAVLLWPSTRERTAWHVVEAAAAVCLLVAVLLAARGSVGAAAAGRDPLAGLLPVLVLVAAGLIAARAWVPLAAWTSRHLPARAVAARLSAATAVHRPLRTVVTVGFLTAAVGTVVFAGAYRATLAAGSADTAAFDVPADARLTLGSSRAEPLDLLASSPLPGTASPVLRTVAGVRSTATTGAAVGLLGVDAAALGSVPRWDRTVGAADAASVAALLRPTSETLVGAPVDDAARRLVVPVRSWQRTPDIGVDVVAWIGTADGRERAVPLTLAGGSLVGDLPDLGPGRRLLALTLRENAADATVHAHQVGEGGTSTELPTGTVVLGTPDAVPSAWREWASRGAQVRASATSLSIDYRLSGSQIVLRPAPTDPSPVRVVTDAATASPGSTLRLDLGGGEALEALVVGTLPRFPTLGERFVVGDRAALSAALDDLEPGSGRAHEAWATGGDAVLAAVRAAPYDRLAVTTQVQRRSDLESDAVSQGAGWLLLVAAGVSLLVGLLALVLLVVAERRDDEAELLAQEADGVTTSTLRRSLWLRAVGAAVPALVAGGVAGLALTRAVASLIELSAGGVAPTPPLLPAVGSGWTAAVLLAGVVLALAVCALAVARMLRSAWPSRSSAVGR